MSPTAESRRDPARRFAVAMLGARMNYAVPRILHAAGMLDRFYTDFSAGSGWGRVLRAWPRGLRPAGVRRLLGRSPDGIPADMITAFNGFGLSYAARLRGVRWGGAPSETYLWAGQKFCNLIIQRGLGAAAGVYAFNSAALEVFRSARQRGVVTILEQTIAPKTIELQLLEEEASAHPGWESFVRDSAAEDYASREVAEWGAADVVICASDFVKDGIFRCGGPRDGIVVVPYGVDVTPAPAARRHRDGPLRVLTVGALGLRKGSPYVLEAAARLAGRAVFRMVGGGTVLPKARRALGQCVEMVGPVPRREVAGHYAWADVFLLPSICEGSATVVYEALAWGLPVICTPNTGSPVRDREDGFLVPIRDSDAIAARIDQLIAAPDLLERMSANALKRASEFTVHRYGQRLLIAIQSEKAERL